MSDYGARIERGTIKEVTADGYRVESFDRRGIITPPIPASGGAAFENGATVYFFVFEDGRGLIIGEA